MMVLSQMGSGARDNMTLITTVLTYTVFIPIMLASASVGVITEADMIKQVDHYNTNTLLKISVRGDDLYDGDRPDWSVIDRILSGNRLDVALWFGTPESMRDGGQPCDLPGQKHWPTVANDIQSMIDLFGPRFVEIWNEPDVTKPSHPDLFGCVGDGGLYGEFVSYIHQNTTGADILAGSVASIDKPFVMDMIEALDGNYDGLSFHCYAFFYGSLLSDCLDQYAYAQSLTNKPVYITETAVIYGRGDFDHFDQAQIDHYLSLLTLPTPWFWYSICNNNWKYTDYCDRPVEDYFMTNYSP